MDIPPDGIPHSWRALSPRAQLLAGLALYLALALGAWILQPGTSGGFKFDDFPNLGGLEALKSDPGPDQLLQFIVGGISSPLGRPLSMASFALQMHDWPSDPASFIRWNLLLHLLNGALLSWVLLRLAALLQLPARAALLVPLASAALWTCAPIQLTSALYVVQRMTELSATFVFAGLLLYLVGRERALRGDRHGLLWMSLGLLVGAGVGSLAKENAALMPLLVAVLEFTLLARLRRPAAWRPWASVFLLLPALAIAGYLALVLVNPGPAYAGREFTLGERLLTEPRVLFLYLYKLLMPWPSAMRLWYDDFPTSTGLLQPWTTLPALLALAALLAAALRWRERFPLAAFAVLWFLAAHLLESSVLPLELVFEHRNYVASAGVWFALACGAQALAARASAAHVRAVVATLGAAYFALLAAITWQVATLWGQPFALTAWMGERLPDSRRAQSELIGALTARGHAEAAVRLAQAAAVRWPDDPSYPLQQMLVSCQVAEFAHPPAADLLRRIAGARSNVNAVVQHLDDLLSLLENAHCPVGLPLPVSALTEAAVKNAALRGQRQNRLLLHARALLLEQRTAESLEFYGRAADADPKMILLLHGAIIAIDVGDLPAARAWQVRAESDPRIEPLDRWSHRANLTALRQKLDELGAPPASR